MPKQNKKTALILQPNGYRFQKIPIKTETPHAAITEPIDEKEIRIWKHPYAPAWTGEDETLFLNVEGKPIIAIPDDLGETQWVDLIEFLRDILTEKVMNRLPPEIMVPLKQHWATQVTVIPAVVDEQARKAMDKLFAMELLHDSNIRQADEWGKSTDEKTSIQKIIEFAMPALIGAFGMYFLVKQGII